MKEIGNGNVLLDVEGHRADVILNRPEKRNAMNESLLRDLRTALEKVDAADDVRVMTLQGKGSVFCAGMDLEMMRKLGRDDSETLDVGLDDITHFIDEMDVVSVASIKRGAIAGAFELVLPVDFRIISRDAKYGVIEVTLGVFPSGGATQRLPRLVGLSKAKEIVLSGDYIDPLDAKEIGLVHEIVDDPDETDERAMAYADDLAENAPLGMKSARELLNSALEMPLDEGLAFESAMGERLTETNDYTEGFTARIEGRDPEFEGK
ncbi:enoyl-CoA hydratase/isomerase family protein [Halomarina halobia]|uniref:Enoyl-CoA hydratase/isomerase family protein n=1 Tax=Halomarina halobia TaxID=3033386 RepID=A0ABD6ACW4_9EURY|nr:enoyl-CoA hydratase/isomerase family protein [Halomarina sp. PSR21]